MAGEEMTIQHYCAIAERGDGRTWWISFPGRHGLVSAAGDAADIVVEAQDCLSSIAQYDGRLPRAIEDGAKPPSPATLAEFEQPTIVVVIPFEHTAEAKAAA
jgi:hypothetical protein